MLAVGTFFLHYSFPHIAAIALHFPTRTRQNSLVGEESMTVLGGVECSVDFCESEPNNKKALVFVTKG